MDWIDEHGLLMLREMVVSGIFSREGVWDSIAEKLNHENSGQRSEKRWQLGVSSLKI